MKAEKKCIMSNSYTWQTRILFQLTFKFTIHPKACRTIPSVEKNESLTILHADVFLYDYIPVDHNKSGPYDKNKLNLNHILQKIFTFDKPLNWHWSSASEIVIDAKLYSSAF